MVNIVQYFPTVKDPEKPLTFHDRLKHTFIVLLIYYLMSSIWIFGVSKEISSRLMELAWLFGSSLGTLTTLGIGPIIMAGILLQLLIGGKILNIDISTEEGRYLFNYYNKLFILVFIVLEALAILVRGVLRPDPTLGIPIPILYFLIFVQLALGALFIVLLDDYCLKYGITSGVNLFILASISKALVIRLFNPFPSAEGYPTGLVFTMINSFLGGNLKEALVALVTILVTFGILILAAYLNTARIEIPLMFVRVGGKIIKFPIRILYTSVIPIILLFALLSEIEMVYMFITKSTEPPAILTRPLFLQNLIIKGMEYLTDWFTWVHLIVYLLIYIIGAAFLSYLWVHAAGMDAKTLAQQLTSSPFFPMRFRDPRIIERTLEKYIKPVSILSGILVGLLAALSDILGSAIYGTSLLLLITIAYSIYEDFVRNNVLHLLPILGKLLRK